MIIGTKLLLAMSKLRTVQISKSYEMRLALNALAWDAAMLAWRNMVSFTGMPSLCITVSNT